MEEKLRDKQKQKVYTWENSQSWMTKKSYLSQDQCKAVIKRLNKIFNRKVIIKFINGNGSCTAYHNEIVIRNNWGRSYGVLLHEFAHCISNDAHGKNFVAEYCMLLHYLHPEQPTIKSLAKSLNKQNVDFSSFDKTLVNRKLSKRHKPFPEVSTVVIPEAIRYVYKRESYKQKCKKLSLKYDWLIIERDWDVYDFTIDVYDQRELKRDELNYDDVETYSWKEAYLSAKNLVERVGVN